MRLAFFIIVSACISAIVQSLLSRLRIGPREIELRPSAKILVILVLRFGTDWNSILSNLMETADEPKNINVAIVFMCSKPDQIVHLPKQWQYKVKLLHVRKTSYSEGVRIAAEQLMESEEFVLLFRGTRLMPGWDTLSIKTHTPHTILCAPPPTKDLVPTFPTLKVKKGRVSMGEPRKMHVVRVKTTPCIVYCETYVFLSSKDMLANFTYHDNQLKQTQTLRLRLMCPCFPCVETGIMRRDDDEWKQLHPGLTCGLTENPSDAECISKYGSIEAAKLQYEFGSQ